ncbi:MAG: hypothetical protein ACPGD5_08805 [Salibacteraceae bacterium]
MKYVLIVIGVLLFVTSGIYFFKLIGLLNESYEFTNYGLGILLGKSILLVFGVFLIAKGINKFKTE